MKDKEFDEVLILLHKEKTIRLPNRILFIKNDNPEEAVIKLNSEFIPDEIDLDKYDVMLIERSKCEHIPFYKIKSQYDAVGALIENLEENKN